jgi:hypothetical protein
MTTRNWKIETGKWKLENRNWKLETGKWQAKLRSSQENCGLLRPISIFQFPVSSQDGAA